MNVGFDLDLTLADTRAGIGAVYRMLSAETGVPIDTDLVVSRLGPPLEVELAQWFPAEQVTERVLRFREIYPSVAVPATTLMRGAAAAVAAVHAAGGRVIVVSGKNYADTVRTVEYLGLPVDSVTGGVFGAEKGAALVEFGARIYVGDHTADIDAARAAHAVAVGVATGPFVAEALSAYGADVVLPDLLAFPAWFEASRSSLLAVEDISVHVGGSSADHADPRRVAR